GLGKVGDRHRERVARTQVRRHGDAVTGARVGSGERPTTGPAIEGHPGGGHALDVGVHLPVPQLAYVEVSVYAVVQARGAEPAQEDVAGRLHEALAYDDPLTLVLELARPVERGQHRRRGFLDLQEQRVV